MSIKIRQLLDDVVPVLPPRITAPRLTPDLKELDEGLIQYASQPLEEKRGFAPGDAFPLGKVMAVVKCIVGSIIAFRIPAIQDME